MKHRNQVVIDRICLTSLFHVEHLLKMTRVEETFLTLQSIRRQNTAT